MDRNNWDDIVVKKGPGGAGKVTEKEKRSLISRAESEWERMGLTQDQRAFGIAVMNVESGFNPDAKGPSKTEKGLGQWTDPTWKDAVNYYNDARNFYRGKNEPKLDPVLSRDDEEAQIKVMGAWVNRVWVRALEIADDPRLKDYSLIERAYAAWHQGVYADVEKDTHRTESLKTFLDEHYNGKLIEFCFNDTYYKAHDTIDILEIMRSRGVVPNASKPYSGGRGSGETLKRDESDYRIVWRIEPDGSESGFFESA